MVEKRKYKCSVLGANGYLGRHLCYLLFQRGFEIFAYDIDEIKNTNIPHGVKYKKVDITMGSDIKEINFDVDFLFFFAGITGTKEGFDNYEKYIQVNEIGLMNVLNSMRKQKKLPVVVFPSTRLVYKGSEKPLKEDAEKVTRTVYAANKLAGENLLKAYWNAFKIPFMVFRISVPYGNLFDHNFSYGTIGFFMNKAKNKENIVLFGDGSLRRTFTHVVSVCNQIIEAVTCGKLQNDIFNIAGETYVLKEVASIIAEKYNVGIEYTEWPELDGLIESGNTVFDASKLSGIIRLKEEFTSFREWVFSI